MRRAKYNIKKNGGTFCNVCWRQEACVRRGCIFFIWLVFNFEVPIMGSPVCIYVNINELSETLTVKEFDNVKESRRVCVNEQMGAKKK